MKKLTVLLSTLLIFYGAGAQQILSGIYSGSMYNDSTKILTKYELALSEYRGKVMGYSYNTFIVNDTFYYGIRRVKGYKNDHNELVLTDEELLANNFPESPAKRVKRTATFPLAQEDTITNLTGTWQTNRTKLYYSVGGPAKTERSVDSAQSPLVAHLKELNIISGGPKYQDDPVAKTKKKDEKKPKELKETDKETAVAKHTEKNGSKPVVGDTQAGTTPADKGVAATTKPTRGNAPGKDAVAAADRKEPTGGNPDAKPATTAPDNRVASASPAGTSPAKDQKPSVAGTTSPANTTVQGNAAPRKEEPAVAKAADKGVTTGNPATTGNNDIDPTTGDLITRKPASDKGAPVASNAGSNKPSDAIMREGNTSADGTKEGTVKPHEPKAAAPQGGAAPAVSSTTQPLADSKPAADKAPAAVAAAAALDTRSSAVIKTLEIVNDSVTLSFYDNGVVDGDVISVFVNGVNVVASQKLNEVAIKKTIHLANFASDSIEVTLVAETLGSIPPNTGLVLVRDGDTRYDVRFSADMKTNASIIFRKARK